jgi:hypothetical protein
MKTHFKKLKNPNYSGSWDLTDKEGNFIEKIVTIEKIVVEKVHDGRGGSEDCTVAYLKELKPMVLNATNLKAIAKITGSNFIEDWVGSKVNLYVQKVKAFGEVHDALRIKKAIKKPKPFIEDDRFKKALESIKSKDYTKEQLKSSFSLTIKQEEELNGI